VSSFFLCFKDVDRSNAVLSSSLVHSLFLLLGSFSIVSEAPTGPGPTYRSSRQTCDIKLADLAGIEQDLSETIYLRGCAVPFGLGPKTPRKNRQVHKLYTELLNKVLLVHNIKPNPPRQPNIACSVSLSIPELRLAKPQRSSF
jgi:hypothetical protein